MKKNCSPSATSEGDVDTSMGVVCTSSRILRWIFSVTFSSSLERKSAAVLIEPAICAILKLNCSTFSHAFHRDGGMAFVWKNRVTFFCPLRQSLVLMFPTECVQTQEMSCRLPKIRSSKLTTSAVRGKNF